MAERLFLDRLMPPGFEDLFVDWDVCGPDDAELATCRAAIAGASQWPAARIASAPSLEVISRSGIGFDTVDLAAATAQGVIVCNTPDAPTISTAEHTMGLLLSVTKSLADNAARLRSGGTEFYAASEAIELAGRTLGVVGYGRIGPRVARAAAALDMHVIVCDPYVTTQEFEMVTFPELLARSDVITLHCPLTDETAHMVDAAAFAAMRPGAVVELALLAAEQAPESERVQRPVAEADRRRSRRCAPVRCWSTRPGAAWSTPTHWSRPSTRAGSGRPGSTSRRPNRSRRTTRCCTGPTWW